jgi:PAS domain S-box-containing protein
MNPKNIMNQDDTFNHQLSQLGTRYRFLFQNSPDIIYTLDEQGHFTSINSAVERLIGYKIDELIGRHYTSIIYEEDLPKAKWRFNERRTGERASSGVEIRLKTFNNGNQLKDYEPAYRTIELTSTGMYSKLPTEKKNTYIGVQGVARDISHRRQLESQLQQSQKMEALGNLAGGVAHDFNNLLMAIEGNAALMLLDMDFNAPHYENLKNIEQCVKNGAELTKQLLSFAKSWKYQAKSTNLNHILKKSSEMFGRTKKETIIHTRYRTNLWPVKIDQGQIEQVLLNLYINAWHAMPEGGDIYLQTDNVTLDDVYVNIHGLKSGNYVKLSVTDTGVGMDEATKEKIFEPFFTTKGRGIGTGLGLASAYGIIHNHDGIITVYSELGKGTTFNIYLPTSLTEVFEEQEIEKELLKGKETILLVDDEEVIIDVGKKIMGSMGYEVLSANSGKEALAVYSEERQKIDLVILDMIMPTMGGKETYDHLKEINPAIKVLLSSGYSLNGQVQEILSQGCDGFIQKPFNIKDLSHKLRDILDSDLPRIQNEHDG